MGVVTTSEIQEGQVFGPIPPTLTLADPAVLIGHRTCDTPPDIHSVKLCISEYRDGVRLAEWVPYVQAARDQHEQNMEAYLSSDGQLYYRTIKSLHPGDELFIWYSDDYAAYMGVPPILPTYSKGSSYACPYCMETFLYANCLRAHLRFKCKYRHHVIMAQKAAIMASAPLQCTVPGATGAKEGTGAGDPKVSCSQSPSKASPQHRQSPQSQCSSPSERSSSRCPSPDIPTCSSHSMASLKRSRDSEDELVSPKRRAVSVSPKSDRGDEMGSRCPAEDRPSPSYPSDECGQEEARSAFQRVDRHKKFGEDAKISCTMSTPSMLPSTASSLPSHHALGGGVATSSILSPNPMNMSMAERSRLLSHPYQMMPGLAGAQLPLSLQAKMGLSTRMLSNENNPLGGLAPPRAGLPDVQQMLTAKHFDNNNLHPKLPFPSELHGLPQGVPYVYRSPNPMVDRILHTSPRNPLQNSLGIAQNWCAKCNATFRMTSDLVYHMRSHHKREFDPVKKKRDDKLRCDVCGETFRERHHLTRHMTSHA